ncbi:E3 ubiquitin-protein ligase XIAP-like isoform X2 [Ornithodoros turicata]|uniref:E3 ubiquitin-protein ligase XIAP-like isoform X2 n=1 Tax=Ornithodoros turicata TaxID=34597 RepID=UPI003138A145
MGTECEQRSHPITFEGENDIWYGNEADRWDEEPECCRLSLSPLKIPHAVVETGTGSTPSQVGVRSDLDSFLKEYPPRHRKVSTYIARFKSFANAQDISKGKWGTLAHNGFCYTGDIIACFHCGGLHAGWRDDDDPVVEHSRWFPECAFMRFHVGDDVVNYIVSEHHYHLKELRERGRREAKVADKEMVEDLLDGEDIRFYEIVGITLEVLYLAASSLKHGATNDDLADSIEKLCSLKLETDWRKIPRNVQGSYPPLRDVFVRDWNPKQDHRDQALGGTVSSPSIFEPSRRSKYPEYADYNERLGTFEGFPFPSMAHFCRYDLAGAGLVYTKIRDETMCFHCGQKLSHWEATDNPYREHQRWHPSCEYIQWKLSGRLTASSSSDHAMNTSEPMEEAPQEGDDRDSGISSMSAGTSTENSVTTDAASEMRPVPAYRSEDVCGNHNPYLAHREPYGNRVNQYSVPHSKPIYQRYASLASRESSFQSYPPNAKGNKEKMAKAGFFYTGTEDRTTCFQCGNSLSNWSNDDDPLYEHARWYPDCAYVVLQLGDEAIENIRRAHSNTLAERMLEERNKSDGKTEFMLENLKSSYLVRRLISQDINRDIVELAIRARLNRTGLVDVLDEQDLRRALGEVVSLPDNVRTREVPKAEGDLSKCIKCKTEDRHIIFLPCSHLVSCSGCAASCTVCPSCDRTIATTREGFLA